MTDTLEAQTRATVGRLHTAVKERGFLSQLEFFAPKHLNHGFPSDLSLVKEVLEDIQNTFPDLQFDVIQTFVQGEWAIDYCLFSGTHLGKAKHPYVHYGLLYDLEPTGKFMRVHHVHMYRIQNGLIVEHEGTRDDVGMVRQLGVKLEPEVPRITASH